MKLSPCLAASPRPRAGAAPVFVEAQFILLVIRGADA